MSHTVYNCFLFQLHTTLKTLPLCQRDAALIQGWREPNVNSVRSFWWQRSSDDSKKRPADTHFGQIQFVMKSSDVLKV